MLIGARKLIRSILKHKALFKTLNCSLKINVDSKQILQEAIEIMKPGSSSPVSVMHCKQHEMSGCDNPHNTDTFEIISYLFRTKSESCQKQLEFLKEEILTKCKETQSQVETQIRVCTDHFANIRSAMMAQGDKIKKAVDLILAENLTTLDSAELDAYNKLKEGESKITQHISHLKNCCAQYAKHIQEADQPASFALFCKENNLKNCDDIPEIPSVPLPEYSTNPIMSEELSVQFGILQLQECVNTYENIPRENQSNIAGADSKSSTMTGHPSTPGLQSCHHISLIKSGKAWISDHMGNLILIDNSKKELKRICCTGGYGFHTATGKDTLLMVNHRKNQITEIQPDFSIKVLFSTGEWTPLCIHHSKLTGDLLIGMKRKSDGCVARYNVRGHQLQKISSGVDGKSIYREPFYITENKNGDICTSDWYQEALVVVNKSGCHRFSYHSTKGTKLCPGGVCTDKRGNILLHEASTPSIHRITQDGVLLDIIIRLYTGFHFMPQGLCLDERQNLWVGTNNDHSLVKVMKYTC